ncbi:ankyrin repeat and protein kinase domain-containing protein 1 [Lingula anatina]|uniref:Ankyrin repeat and protein kinase domain-containing protein 1 n=1 Tax=Lingula anatina TaxID=7574 RepID=A0A1S3JL64_LINAN|nr:ankyrin repeat and protein kinase domain-containing protein 1 [Lingula anatina]|eukprot:XP_013410881.1 ankyrin repeat and protein kinase domain-containing protein 1 [Lingula anatina]
MSRVVIVPVGNDESIAVLVSQNNVSGLEQLWQSGQICFGAKTTEGGCSNPDCNAREHGEDLIWAAVQYGHCDVIRWLISHGANLAVGNSRDHWKRQPVHFAACDGHIPLLQVLLTSGVNVNTLDAEERTPLHWAATFGQHEVAKYLISCGANVNIDAAQNNGFTPLHAAACLGHTKLCKLFLEHGAAINEADKDGWTTLHVASCYYYPDIVKLLLDHGASVNQETVDKQTALHICVENRDTVLAGMLIEAGVALNLKDKRGYTALHWAVYHDKILMVKYLINYGADLNTVNEKQQGLLETALTQADTNMIQLLHAAGANIYPELNSHNHIQQIHTLRQFENNCYVSINRNVIEALATNPRKLQELCSLRIRSCLKPNYQQQVRFLPLPAEMKSYVALKHL